RTIAIQVLQFILILMRGDDHYVWPDTELFVYAHCLSRSILNPRTHVHVRDSYPVDLRCSTRKALFHPLHENAIEASRFVMRIPRYSWETTPFTASLAKNAIFATWCGWPIENRRVAGDEGGARSQSVSNLLGIGCRELRHRNLRGDSD